jgi:hypothetical protein
MNKYVTISHKKIIYRAIEKYFSLTEFTFLAQWWSNSNCVAYIDRNDLEKADKEHLIIM